MALTYGFYSSTNGDRKYSADQFGSLFEGIITNGVFMGIGRALEVTAGNNLAETGLYVTVKSGRCWFNHTWLDNTDDFEYPSNLPILCMTGSTLSSSRSTRLRVFVSRPL